MSKPKKPAAGNPDGVGPRPFGIEKQRVLLIEDEPLISVVLLNEFQMAGFNVRIPPGGQLSLNQLSYSNADAIFLDLPLRGLDGMELIKEARQDPEFANRPIYVCDSAFFMDTRARQLTKAGATKVFDKSSTPIHVILAEVAAHLKGETVPAEPANSTAIGKAEADALQEIPTKCAKNVAGLRAHLEVLAKCKDNEARAAEYGTLRSMVQSVVSLGAATGMRHMAREAAALEAFLKELCQHPNRITDSSLRTVSLAVDVLELLACDSDPNHQQELSELVAIVIDDEQISSTAICSALTKTGFSPRRFATVAAALEYLGSHPVDLVVLDVMMAAQSGSDLYNKLRELPLHQETPVIFVTNPNDPKRSSEVLATYDTQFLVKPYAMINYLELALKSLSQMFKSRSRAQTTVSARSRPFPPAPPELPKTKPIVAVPQTKTLPSVPPGMKPGSAKTSFSTPIVSKSRVGQLKGPAVAVPQVLQPPASLVGGTKSRVADVQSKSPAETAPPGPSPLPASTPNPYDDLQRQLQASIVEVARYREALTAKETEREELAGKVLSRETELKGVQSSLTQESQTRQELEEKLRDVWVTKAHSPERVAAEQELAKVRQTCDELKTKLRAEQEASAQSHSSERVAAGQELAKLRETCHELQTKLTAEQHAAAQSHSSEQVAAGQELAKLRQTCQELQTKLTAEQHAAAQSRSSEQGAAGQELAKVRQSCDELKTKLIAEQEAAAQSKRAEEDMEKLFRQTAEELERLKVASAKQAAEAPAPDSASRPQLDAVKQAEATLKEKNARCSQLEQELAGLQNRLRESETSRESDLSQVDQRVRDRVSSLARVTADLEKERAERCRIEQRAATLAEQLQVLHGQVKQHLESEMLSQKRITDVEQQLREREDTVARANADLKKESADRQLAEEQLRASGDLSAHLGNCLASFEAAKKGLKRTQDELETRLQTSQNALTESESKLQKEVTERQRLADTLNIAEHNLQEQSQKGAGELSHLQSELSKLQSTLEVEQAERIRLQGDAIQSRYASLDSARVGRTVVSRLQKQIREPMDHLMQSTRRLLEVQLQEEQKKLVESMLENILVLQTSLQELDHPVPGDSGGAAQAA